MIPVFLLLLDEFLHENNMLYYIGLETAEVYVETGYCFKMCLR
jgi:hypothetical protein